MKRRKIYYVPGMISLLGLPFMALFVIEKPSPILHTIKIFVPSEEKNSKTIARFSQAWLYKEIEKKKIVTVDLNQEYYDSTTYLFDLKKNFIISEIAKIKFTNDSTTVLKIKLGAFNNMGDFVWVLNEAMLFQLRRYTFTNNCFFLFADPPQ